MLKNLFEHQMYYDNMRPIPASAIQGTDSQYPLPQTKLKPVGFDASMLTTEILPFKPTPRQLKKLQREYAEVRLPGWFSKVLTPASRR